MPPFSAPSKFAVLIFVHPFDDRHIVAGQGTIALEVLSEEPALDGILAPAVAAVIANPTRYRNGKIAVVVSGGNIDLSEWIQRLNG